MLDERTERVLWAVIQSYIENPDPVGSRYVTKKYAFSYSPATIRNIMADLEDMGYLKQPHTSAGRVPTDKGYRYFVEHIISRDIGYDERLVEELERRIKNMVEDMDGVLNEATKTLSTLSHFLGLAISPGPEGSTLRRIELVPYKDDRIAVLILTDEGVIKHKIIKNEFSLTANDLSSIAKYLNREFTGYTIKEIRNQLVKELAEDKNLCDTLIERALKLCHESLDEYGANVFITGLSSILDLPDFTDIEKIKELSKAIEDKHKMIKLLDRIVQTEVVQVVIGSENPIKEMSAMSIIASTYKDKDRPAGIVGVIGPKRMDYKAVITLVDTAARYLSKIFEEGGGK